MMHYRLPPGSGSQAILGYTRHEWGTVHFYAAIALIALVALHVFLHWKWVTNTFGTLVRPRGERKAGAGAGGAAILIAIALVTAAAVAAPWAFPIGIGTRRGGEGEGQGKGHRGGKDGGGARDDGSSPASSTSPASAPSETGKGRGRGGGREGIRGSTTLADVAAEAGVPVERILAELKLPAATSPAETLGRLRQQHGFTMQDVRDLVARLKQQNAATPP